MTIIKPGPTDHPARWWRQEGDALMCLLCPRRCLIPEGMTGFCNTRANLSGKLITLTYGRVCATAVDPVEKKPIFHFHPGAMLYSVGTFGCNLDCGFCQNAVLARSNIDEAPSDYVPPDELVRTALDKKVDGIGWTFNDPVVWSEYIIDVSMIAHDRGLFSLLNTNGYIEPQAREDLLENIDAVKVDIKGFDERTYREMCQGELTAVLETCISVKEKGIHLELAYPVIPGKTSDFKMLAKFGDWVIDELDRDIPIHLFRFQPAYRLSHLQSLEISQLKECRKLLLEAGLRFVYLGGVMGEDQDTYCPACGKVVILRKAEEAREKIFVRKEQVSRFCPTFSKVNNLTIRGCCPHCGESLPIH
ncbi:MAG: AmmeMemoRadiSam system radical SAM enzyme [Methanomassiliicoccales archaeon]|jgi:pyruvate formate lyase activating enzyme